MRNLSVPEACLIVGTAVIGSVALLALETARFDRPPVLKPSAESRSPDLTVHVAASAPELSLPPSAPLAPPPPPKPLKTKKVKYTHEHQHQLDRELDLDGSDDPLSGLTEQQR
jgi:hypothetical protein